MNPKPSFKAYLAFFWGVGGIVSMLVWAVVRLTPAAVATFDYDLSAVHWISLAIFLVFMGHSEGYKGFQQSFAPRVAKRSIELLARPKRKRMVLAPLFLVGYFDAEPRVLLVAWGITSMVILLIIGMRWVTQPWRGIIDIGVVFGLSWGILATLLEIYRTHQRFVESQTGVE